MTSRQFPLSARLPICYSAHPRDAPEAGCPRNLSRPRQHTFSLHFANALHAIERPELQPVLASSQSPEPPLFQGRAEGWISTYPPSEDLVDGRALLQRALGHHFGTHLLHVQHERVQRFLYVRLLFFYKQKQSRQDGVTLLVLKDLG
jgi:hypothetical protein